MIQIKHLTIYHNQDNRCLIKGFDVVINNNDKVAIIGEEGNGKSTLLKWIYDPKIIDPYTTYQGSIQKNDHKIGYLPQEMNKNDQLRSIYDYLSTTIYDHNISPKDLAKIAKKLHLPLDIFYEDQLISTLSGGEKIKIQMACILMQGADLLLLDEPSNDLDIDTLQWLERFIKESDIPIVYISHDEVLLENTTNKIIHIEQIKRKQECRITVSKSDYQTYMQTRERSLSHQEQMARSERSDYHKQQEKFDQIRKKVEYRQNTISRQDPHGAALLKKSMHRIKAYEARFEKEYQNMTEIPQTEDAIYIDFDQSVSIPNGKVILHYDLPHLQVGERILSSNIHLEVKGPQKICIIGRNGCGKTTLIRKIAEELLQRTDMKVFYMPQNYDELLPLNQTPIDYLCQDQTKDERSKIGRYLGSMKYTTDEMNHSIRDLSGGQRAKLMFLKMILTQSNVLILDEPTRNLSPFSAAVIRDLLKEFKGVIISISHDRKYIREVIEKVYVLTEEGLVLSTNDMFQE